MAVAMIYSEAPPKGRGYKESATELGFSQELVRKARLVLHWAPDQSDAVLKGAAGITEAYEDACSRRDSVDLPVKRFNALMTKRPDLADRVTNNQLSIDEAEAISKDDEEKERTQCQARENPS